MVSDALVDRVIRLIEPDRMAVEVGRKRQDTIGRGESPDYLPLSLEGVPVEERRDFCQSNRPYCRFDHRERFYDEKKMLFEKAWGLVGSARAASDGQLSVAPEMGAGFLPSILGLKQELFEDKDPWLRQRMSKDEINDLEEDDIDAVSDRGLMPRAIQTIEYFQEKLGSKSRVFIDYTWGPFSLAHLIRGERIFMDILRDPEFVHHLMEITTRLYVMACQTLKEEIGEVSGQGYKGRFFMSDAGVWSNEDTAILLSPGLAEEFLVPYLRRAYSPFGGAIVHLCGKADHLLELLLDIPEVKGINLGEPGKQDMSYEQIMGMVLERGKVYYGRWPRSEGEDTEAYFRRILCRLEERKGLVLSYRLDSEERDRPGKVMDLWHRLQDQL